MPNLEDAKMKYLMLINKVVTLPYRFTGVNDENPEVIFSSVVQK
jgi:hypothetical protein